MLVAQSCPTLRLHGLYARVLCLWNSPGKNTGVGSLFLHQGIFSTQGLNPGLWHCRVILYHLSHQGKPNHLNFLQLSGLSHACSVPGFPWCLKLEFTALNFQQLIKYNAPTQVPRMFLPLRLCSEKPWLIIVINFFSLEGSDLTSPLSFLVVQLPSCVQLFETPCTAALQASL